MNDAGGSATGSGAASPSGRSLDARSHHRRVGADAPGEPAGTEVTVRVPATPETPFEQLSFPRQSARTQRFTLGEPRTVEISADGSTILFARSRGPVDPVNCLWAVDAASGDERLLADPGELLAGDDDRSLPPEELARRERLRESLGGITGYATDADTTLAAFALAGRLFVADVGTGEAYGVAVSGPVFDPRAEALAQRVAYVSGATVCVASLDGTSQVIAGGASHHPAEPDTVTWGSPDHIAAEEMHRFRGYWWSPDGTRIAACRVDNAAVTMTYIADPASPHSASRRAPLSVRRQRQPGRVAARRQSPRRLDHRCRVGSPGIPYLATVSWTTPGCCSACNRATSATSRSWRPMRPRAPRRCD